MRFFSKNHVLTQIQNQQTRVVSALIIFKHQILSLVPFNNSLQPAARKPGTSIIRIILPTTDLLSSQQKMATHLTSLIDDEKVPPMSCSSIQGVFSCDLNGQIIYAVFFVMIMQWLTFLTLYGGTRLKRALFGNNQEIFGRKVLLMADILGWIYKIYTGIILMTALAMTLGLAVVCWDADTYQSLVVIRMTDSNVREMHDYIQ